MAPMNPASICIRIANMVKYLCVVPLTLLMAFSASAQQRQDPGCARDVSRFCRAVIDQGDMVVLSCLQQNRARLSKTCAKVLTDNGR
jgi:hypothetical protein